MSKTSYSTTLSHKKSSEFFLTQSNHANNTALSQQDFPVILWCVFVINTAPQNEFTDMQIVERLHREAVTEDSESDLSQSLSQCDCQSLAWSWSCFPGPSLINDV